MNAVVEHTTETKSAYDRLKRRHRRFVDAYIEGATGAEAVRKAGCKTSHPRNLAYKLLQIPDIREAIEIRERQLVADLGVRHERLIREMYAIATSDARKLVDPETGQRIPLHKLDDATAACIAAVDIEEISTGGREGTRYKYKLWDKNKAADKLGQYLKLWDSVKAQVNVQNNDNRSVTTVIAASPEALSGAVRLLEQAKSIAVVATAAPSDSDGSVLPAALRDESAGRGTPVDADADSGSSGAA